MSEATTEPTNGDRLAQAINGLMAIVEGAGCQRWAVAATGFRLKDTPEWVELYNAVAAAKKAPPTDHVLTCVFCGQQYPIGTPASGSEVLTAHIKVCAKHPMSVLRKALVGLVGCDGKAELERFEAILRVSPAPAADKAAAIDGVHALLATLPGTETTVHHPLSTN